MEINDNEEKEDANGPRHINDDEPTVSVFGHQNLGEGRDQEQRGGQSREESENGGSDTRGVIIRQLGIGPEDHANLGDDEQGPTDDSEMTVGKRSTEQAIVFRSDLMNVFSAPGPFWFG